MLKWKAEAKQLRRERDEAIEQRDRILDDLEDLIHKHDQPESTVTRWTISESAKYRDHVCKMCHDPFIIEGHSVCDSCWRAETGE